MHNFNEIPHLSPSLTISLIVMINSTTPRFHAICLSTGIFSSRPGYADDRLQKLHIRKKSRYGIYI